MTTQEMRNKYWKNSGKLITCSKHAVGISINPKIMLEARLFAARALILNECGQYREAHQSFMQANELMRDATI